ncbi:MAG: glycoside hydrolase family 3 protein [Lachnospiraceae bacterium]|nr:glycoside hydrolase family 3 protein [Lachnospiraceae bacterium]
MGNRRKKKGSKKRIKNQGSTIAGLIVVALMIILGVELFILSRSSGDDSTGQIDMVEITENHEDTGGQSGTGNGTGEASSQGTPTADTGTTGGTGSTEAAEPGAADTDEAEEKEQSDGAAAGGVGDSTAADGQDENGQTTGGQTADSVEEQALEILSDMTLWEQVCQLFIVTPEQLTGVSVATQAGETTKQALSDYPVGGIVYFAANILTRDQCSTMISNSQSYSKIGLFIAVDEEGGTVARIGNNSAMGTTSFPDMKTIGDTGNTQNAYEVGYTIGSEISELGFNLDFAPVADVDSNPDNPVIGDRSFGSDATVVSEMVAAAVQGFHDGGILCTLKHFPGHGDTSTDSHEGYTELTKTLAELWETELVPFAGGISAGADFVMVGHISVPQVTGSDLPATLSDIMISILRDDLGFDGLIITDSMQMEAITDRYSSAEAAVMAIQAGVDMILMPENLQEAVEGVYEAVQSGEISEARLEESVLRILETKIRSGIIR